MTFGTDFVLNVGPRDHVVLFYRDEAELADQVSGHLLRAIRGGGSAVVIATHARRLALSERLSGAGMDIAAERQKGSYAALDAARTLEEFVTGGWADPAMFWRSVSPVIARAAAAGQPVRVFGEMVALLWDAGLTDAAIEVEAMWNELAAQYPFSVVCGYAESAVSDAAAFDALTEICGAHVAVMGSPPPGIRNWRYR